MSTICAEMMVTVQILEMPLGSGIFISIRKSVIFIL